MKKWLLGFCALLVLAGVAAAYQSGQLVIPMTTGRFLFDNGGPQNTVLQVTIGTVTLNGATPVTVANTAVTATSQIQFTLKTVGGTVGASPAIQTITPGTGFTVQGTASDTSIYNFMIEG